MTNQLCSVVDFPSFIITSTLPPDTRLQEVMLFAMYGEAGSQDTLATTHCLRHDLSCDIDKRAEEWIRKAHAPKLYVQKLDNVSDMIVWDTISQSFQPMPQNFACICSWACQDVCFGLKMLETYLFPINWRCQIHINKWNLHATLKPAHDFMYSRPASPQFVSSKLAFCAFTFPILTAWPVHWTTANKYISIYNILHIEFQLNIFNSHKRLQTETLSLHVYTVICGCHSRLRSTRNPKRKLDCISGAYGQTGSTFQEYCQYLSRHSPTWFYSEMVPSFVQVKSAESLTQSFKHVGSEYENFRSSSTWQLSFLLSDTNMLMVILILMIMSMIMMMIDNDDNGDDGDADGRQSQFFVKIERKQTHHIKLNQS